MDAGCAAVITLLNGTVASRPALYHDAPWRLTNERLSDPDVWVPPSPSLIARLGYWAGAAVPLGPQSENPEGALLAAGGYHESTSRTMGRATHDDAMRQ